MSHFEILKKSKTSKARAGILHTPHGPINTPVFMPVGTQGTVKSMTPQHLHDCNTQIILGNTYHLSLRPGADNLEAFGGLHQWIGWNKPILTDSGGFQVFSLSKIRKIKDEGVTFQSHIDGTKHLFTPKSVIDLQLKFGSDIMMPLDICTPYPATEEQTLKDLHKTHAWEQEAADYWRSKQTKNLLFAIVQGGMYPHLRDQSVETLTKLDLPGYAIGGVSVGEPIDKMYPIIAHTTPQLPENKPRYLMGVGLPENLKFAIEQGIDMFDCVLPTRLARHGQVFTSQGKLTIKNEQFKLDQAPIDPTCTCYTCTHFSKSYLRHLFMAKELLAMTLLSIHNVHYLIHFVDKIRQEILSQS
jgi:queuine tRNA-ribosyltransferase